MSSFDRSGSVVLGAVGRGRSIARGEQDQRVRVGGYGEGAFDADQLGALRVNESVPVGDGAEDRGGQPVD